MHAIKSNLFHLDREKEGFGELPPQRRTWNCKNFRLFHKITPCLDKKRESYEAADCPTLAPKYTDCIVKVPSKMEPKLTTLLFNISLGFFFAFVLFTCLSFFFLLRSAEFCLYVFVFVFPMPNWSIHILKWFTGSLVYILFNSYQEM